MDNKKNETAEITSFNADIVEPAALVELNDDELAHASGGYVAPEGCVIKGCTGKIKL